MEKLLHKSKISDKIRPDSCQSRLTMRIRQSTIMKFKIKKIKCTKLCPWEFLMTLQKSRVGKESEHEQYEKEFNPDERHTRAFVARFPGVY